jgi:hypothetical protein
MVAQQHQQRVYTMVDIFIPLRSQVREVVSFYRFGRNTAEAIFAPR